MLEPQSYRSHARGLWALGLPLIFSHLAQIAVATTDTLMIGWYGVDELAAVALISALGFTLMIVGAGFAFAVVPLVASAAEAGDERQIRRVTRMGLWLSAIYFVLILPLMIYAEPILLALGQEALIAKIARDYALINVWSILAALFVMVLKSYLSALEITRIVMLATGVAAVLNALVNYVLIFGHFGAPELGVRGAAIASVISAGISGLILAIYAIRKLPEHRLFRNLWRPDREVLHQVFRLGWPIGLTNLAETSLFAASSVMMGWLGAATLAAHGIALQITSIFFMIHVGLSTAATVRAGRSLGRRDQPNLRRGAQVALASSVAVSLLTIVLYVSLPETLIGIFTDPDDPERPAIIAIGVTLLLVSALFQLADGAQVMALGLLRGLQDTRAPMIIAAISYWGIGISFSYVLGFVYGLGGVGIWLGLVAGLGAAGAALHYRFWSRLSSIV